MKCYLLFSFFQFADLAPDTLEVLELSVDVRLSELLGHQVLYLLLRFNLQQQLMIPFLQLPYSAWRRLQHIDFNMNLAHFLQPCYLHRHALL